MLGCGIRQGRAKEDKYQSGSENFPVIDNKRDLANTLFSGKLFLKVHSSERQSCRDTEKHRERERDLPSACSLSKSPQQLRLGQHKSRSLTSVSVAQISSPSSAAFPSMSARSWIGKGDSNLRSCGMWLNPLHHKPGHSDSYLQSVFVDFFSCLFSRTETP